MVTTGIPALMAARIAGASALGSFGPTMIPDPLNDRGFNVGDLFWRAELSIRLDQADLAQLGCFVIDLLLHVDEVRVGVGWHRDQNLQIVGGTRCRRGQRPIPRIALAIRPTERRVVMEWVWIFMAFTFVFWLRVGAWFAGVAM